jgi:hypothetical protein
MTSPHGRCRRSFSGVVVGGGGDDDELGVLVASILVEGRLEVQRLGGQVFLDIVILDG